MQVDDYIYIAGKVLESTKVKNIINSFSTSEILKGDHVAYYFYEDSFNFGKLKNLISNRNIADVNSELINGELLKMGIVIDKNKFYCSALCIDCIVFKII